MAVLTLSPNAVATNVMNVASVVWAVNVFYVEFILGDGQDLQLIAGVASSHRTFQGENYLI